MINLVNYRFYNKAQKYKCSDEFLNSERDNFLLWILAHFLYTEKSAVVFFRVSTEVYLFDILFNSFYIYLLMSYFCYSSV